jgi:uncharacterized protein (TIGR02145 family)
MVDRKKLTMKNTFYIIIWMLMIDSTVAQSGNVGVGTTSPSAKLHVNGTFKVTDGTQGADKVLTSDATGKGTWQTVASLLPPSEDSLGVNEVAWVGCSAWATKNLNVRTYRNGQPIAKITNSTDWMNTTSGAYCFYNNDSTQYYEKYGRLYNWYAVNDPRGLAPEGWHIPSEFEWTSLINTLGGNTVAGGMMKSIGTIVWAMPNTGATDLCNFSAQPGGYRGTLGGFNVEGTYGYWWSATKSEGEISWGHNMNYNDTEINGIGSDWNFGYSVRCVKD